MMPSPATTPRPNAASRLESTPDDATTPTRATFSAAASGQKPLPTSPFPQSVQIPESTDRPKRDNSQHSSKSSNRDSVDIDMDDSDGEGADDVSDDESVNADGTRSGKKKKSQRFYCTDYPPCNLSFTRSEHLARHIRPGLFLTANRKHTGERPFQCHCSRRFSRLDNLRQHAQTVHVNEDIPVDSLAATGSRFQRQMRTTERVRQAGNRARASTGGSAGGPIRGHSKSLSTSSIASIGSVGSAYGMQTLDMKRRPPPLVMADPRQRLSLESYRSTADSAYSYRPPSPGDFSAPTSATFSTGQSSPRWSGMASPTSSHSRSHSMYVTGTRTPGRRLSVPSGANPFQSLHPHGPMQPVFGPGHINSSNAGTFSPNSSLLSSPTASTSGWSVRRDSTSSNMDEAWRRRTWHPDSRSSVINPPHPSQIGPVVNQAPRPNPPPPMANPVQSQSSLRLPGIESFDPIPHRPATPPRRNPSPMMIDSAAPRPQPPTLEGHAHEDRRNLNLYDASLHRGLNRLDINHSTPPRDSAGAWASEVHKAVQAQAEQVRINHPTVRFEDPHQPMYQHPTSMPPARAMHQHTMSAPSMPARENKRHGWYNGPVHREGVPTPDRAAHVDRLVHPNFQGFSGFPARDQQAQQQPPPQERPNPDPLGRLEALVAVATSESSTATAC
ncbi:hypothetical protein B0I35DRAFT_346064 [Stachybotrys elegans]|uniref:C2H2-type domain-containing protein n=1 Tax=Stachybotrys elegans TaxID=80388 RepID=A0A8K0T1S7_9HYPO|nr:hypothetical protein B0I35DRAFT_346064 [Stachybotrys elegans]